MKFSFTFTGVEKLRRKLGDAQDRLPELLAKQLRAEADGIIEPAKAFVPLDTGTLMRSGKVRGPFFSGNSVEVKIGFGDAAVEYAEVQHENLDFYHPNGRVAKYLQIPFESARARMPQRIMEGAVAEAFGLEAPARADTAITVTNPSLD